MTRSLGSLTPVTLFLISVIGCGGSRAAKDVEADKLAAQTKQYADQLESNDDVEWLTVSDGPRNTDPRAYQRPSPPSAISPAHTPPVHTAPAPAPAPFEPVRPAVQPAPVEPEALSQAELVRRLSGELAARAEASGGSLKPWLARAALAAIDPTYELSAADLGALSPDDRRAVLAYQRTFSQLARTLDGPAASDRAALVNLAQELGDELAGNRTLTIRRAELCKKVKGYGVYEPFDRKVFLAGRKQPVIVYLELDHFATRRSGDNHIAELTQEVVLYNDADGLPVWRQKPVTIRDASRNMRRDFFVVQVVNLSDRLTVGKYDMKVTVTDEVGMTVDETTVPIEVVADPSLAVSGR